MPEITNLKGVAEKDRKLIEGVEALFGPEPSTMGFAKNLFWGKIREELVFPYPKIDQEETARCDALLVALDHYLETEHPAVQIDQEQEIPRWVIERLFNLGVMGMVIPREYGGGGFSVTSYNHILEHIGRTCASTAVLVSAHQSIGCKAIALFGTEEQKQKWLPHLASNWLSAFCLSEPDVGCDAAGQQTRCEISADGTHFVLNGEKKWSTSAPLSQIFTVMAQQVIPDPQTGKPGDKVTALVCTPDMPGVEIVESNRSKCGIRGTWQGRIRFTNVKVPRANLLHKEGKGMSVALTCLDHGRCTLSAGMLGGATRAFEQAVKWARTRYQFQRPVGDFELVQAAVARMSALTYAMDAVLYMTTGMIGRGDPDIMVESGICKCFCSEMGWRVVNDAMQVMGGEGYMTENEIERIFRDSRINTIVEGTNEVIRSFIFGYGGKQLAEQMLGVQQAVRWNHAESVVHNLSRIWKGLTTERVVEVAVPLGAELLLGKLPESPDVPSVNESLKKQAESLAQHVRQHSHQFKVAAKHYGEKIVEYQVVQARLADSAIWLHAWACVLSKLDRDISAGSTGPRFEQDQAAALYFMDMAAREVNRSLNEVIDNDDTAMRSAAQAAIRYSDTLPNNQFIIPESSPVAKGSGRQPVRKSIKQFSGSAPGTRVADYGFTVAPVPPSGSNSSSR